VHNRLRHLVQAGRGIRMRAQPAAQTRIAGGDALQFRDRGVVGRDDGVVGIVDFRILRAQRGRPAQTGFIRRR
jgi:hypothetical protein